MLTPLPLSSNRNTHEQRGDGIQSENPGHELLLPLGVRFETLESRDARDHQSPTTCPSSGTRTRFQIVWSILIETVRTLPSIMATLMNPEWALENVVVSIFN